MEQPGRHNNKGSRPPDDNHSAVTPTKNGASHAASFSLYTNQELQRIHSCTSAYKDKDEWFKTPDGRVILPTDFATHLVQQVHQSTHLGEKKMQDDLLRKTHLRVVGLKAKMAEALGWCLKCHLVNAKSMVIRTGHRERRTKNQTRNKLGNQLHWGKSRPIWPFIIQIFIIQIFISLYWYLFRMGWGLSNQTWIVVKKL